MTKLIEWEQDIETITLEQLRDYKKSIYNLLQWTLFNKNYEDLHLLLSMIDSRIEILIEEEEE